MVVDFLDYQLTGIIIVNFFNVRILYWHSVKQCFVLIDLVADGEFWSCTYAEKQENRW